MHQKQPPAKVATAWPGGTSTGAARAASASVARTMAAKDVFMAPGETGMLAWVAAREAALRERASSARAHLRIMPSRKEDLREERAAQRDEHVPLRVPDVSLRAEEGFGGGARARGDPPLDELVQRADGKGDAGHEEEEPSAARDHALAHEDLARHHRRHEALREVADAVVVVAREPEVVAQVVEERHLGIGVLAAHEQDRGVQRDEHQHERGEAPARI